jgi:hypothetical protein
MKFYILLLWFGILLIRSKGNEAHVPNGVEYKCEQNSGTFTLKMISSNEAPISYALMIQAKPLDLGAGISAVDESKALSDLLTELKTSGFDLSKISSIYLPIIISNEAKQRVAEFAIKSARWKNRTQESSASALTAILENSGAFAEINRELVVHGLAVKGYSVERILVERGVPKRWVTFVRVCKP